MEEKKLSSELAPGVYLKMPFPSNLGSPYLGRLQAMS